MKCSIVTLIAGAALMGGASSVMAQGRDAADRGQRLEINELRNDAAQRRLRQPKDSSLLPPPQQGEPNDRGSKKSSQKR